MESVLLSLLLLACPVGMGAMMWFMMRGQKKQGAPTSVTDLRAEKARLTQEIDDLERRQLTEPVGGRH